MVDYQGILEQSKLTPAEQRQRAKIMKDLAEKPDRERKQAFERVERFAAFRKLDDVTRANLLMKTSLQHPIKFL